MCLFLCYVALESFSCNDVQMFSRKSDYEGSSCGVSQVAGIEDSSCKNLRSVVIGGVPIVTSVG